MSGLAPMDLLKLGRHSGVKAIFQRFEQEDERVLFSANVAVDGFPAVMVISAHAVYSLDPKDLRSCLRRIQFSKILSISASSGDKVFVHISGEAGIAVQYMEPKQLIEVLQFAFAVGMDRPLVVNTVADIEQVIREHEVDYTEEKACLEDFEELQVMYQSGKGETKVSLCRYKPTGEYWALSKVEKNASVDALIEVSKHQFLAGVDVAFNSDDGKFAYVVSDYVENGSLATIWAGGSRLSEAQTRMLQSSLFSLVLGFIAAELLVALTHLHQFGVVMRHLNSKSLQIDNEGHIVLQSLYSLHKAVDTKSSDFFYLAPEVVLSGTVGPEADWWSFGVLLYEMIIGAHPFPVENLESYSAMFSSGKDLVIPLPPAISKEAKSLIQSLLVVDKDKRLGNGARGAANIAAHKFFSSIVWKKIVERSIAAPFVPPPPGKAAPAWPTSPAAMATPPRPKLAKTLQSPALGSKGRAAAAAAAKSQDKLTTATPKSASRSTRSGKSAPTSPSPSITDYGKHAQSAPSPTIYEHELDRFEMKDLLRGTSVGEIWTVIDRENGQLLMMDVLSKTSAFKYPPMSIDLPRLEHSFVARTMKVVQTETDYYLFSHLIPGGDLSYFLSHLRHFNETETRFIAAEVLAGISYIHSQGLVIGNLQPSSIGFDAEGHVLIPSTCLVRPQSSHDRLVYYAPEVLRGTPYSVEADYWSFGILLYVCALGIEPYIAQDPASLLEEVQYQEALYFPESISPALQDLIIRLLTIEPGMRLGSGVGNEGAIAAHPFFDGIDWPRLLAKKIPPPFEKASYSEEPAAAPAGPTGPASAAAAAVEQAQKVRAAVSAKVGIDDFQRISALGKGSFGKVVKVEKVDTGEIFAMKVLDKAKVFASKVVDKTLNEKRVLERTSHPFLVGLKYSFQSETKLFLVMDFVDGGELLQHLKVVTRFTEPQARFIIAEALLALSHLHQQNIIYRDLKPANILLEASGHIKLADFGLVSAGLRAKSICGTPTYMAPEVLSGTYYGKEVDWWGLGVLLFELVTGKPPFIAKSVPKIFEMIRGKSKILVPEYLSDECRDLIYRLLTRDPRIRLGFGDEDGLAIAKHRFFRGIDWEKLMRKELRPPYQPPSSASPFNTKLGVDDTFFAGPAVTERFADWSFVQQR